MLNLVPKMVPVVPVLEYILFLAVHVVKAIKSVIPKDCSISDTLAKLSPSASQAEGCEFDPRHPLQ